VCTDVSETLLAYAGRKFSAYPFVRYGVFDIEKSPAAQGYAEHAFDLVVAANVVHATRDLRSSLQHARALLAPGGVLVLYEVTRQLPWFDMSVGLIEGWERFADDLRRDNPLLPPHRWADVLAETGFVAVETLPAAGAPAEILGHHVILALAPANVSAALASPARRLTMPSVAAAPGLVVTTPTTAPTVNGAHTLAAELFAANAEDRHDRLVEYVREHVVHVLRLGTGRVIDRRHRLMDLGLDSLMAVELRNRLGHGLGLSVPATVVFDYPTIDAVAGFLERELTARRVDDKPGGSNGPRELAGSVATPERCDPSSPEAMAIAELRDDEVEAMLLRKLESL
jgi:acyl carrier protein